MANSKAIFGLLQDAHLDANLDGVMCRNLISVDWRGYVYDCDFNQMLDLPMARGPHRRVHLADLLDEYDRGQSDPRRRPLLWVHSRPRLELRRRIERGGGMSGTALSIIMPVLDEAAGIEAALTALAPYRDRGAEVIVVDGGSRDGTRALARRLADCVLAAPRGRAMQMNAGARSREAMFCCSCTPTLGCPTMPMRSYSEGLAQSGRAWGRFDVRFDRRGLLSLDCFHDELALAFDRNCDRRSGLVRHPRSVRCRPAVFRQSH